MFQYKQMTPDALIAELQTFVGELAQAASAGDYDARQWLCESFPGHCGHFHAVWSNTNYDRQSTNERMDTRPVGHFATGATG